MRRTVIVAAALAAASLALVGCSTPTSSAGPSPSATVSRGPVAAEDPRVADLRAAVSEAMDVDGLAAVLVEIREGEEVLLREAWGESVPGSPATTQMHFRNGAIAITELAVVVLQLVEERRLSLDDTIDRWLPDVPSADRVTVRELASMTSGYPDYEANPALVAALMADPFREWTTASQIAWGTDTPLHFAPGTNWSYAHTNYVLLGLVIEAVTGQSLADIISDRLLIPLGLTQTAASDGPAMLEPALHAIDAERRHALQIPPNIAFFEDSTGWNPGWSLAHGAIQNADIADTATLWRAIGRGDLLTDTSQAVLTNLDARAFAHPQDGCATCRTMDEHYTYGFGLPIINGWYVQNPSFHGYGGIAAYDPAQDVTVAIVATHRPSGFAPDGSSANGAQQLFDRILPLL